MNEQSPKRLYKFLKRGGVPAFGGHGVYFLPVKNRQGVWTPGLWMPKIQGELYLCENGYHLINPENLLDWLSEELYEAEYRGDFVTDGLKTACRQVRLLRRVDAWNEKSARRFACWCVRNTPLRGGGTVWNLLTGTEQQAIQVTEAYVDGEATEKERLIAIAGVQHSAIIDSHATEYTGRAVDAATRISPAGEAAQFASRYAWSAATAYLNKDALPDEKHSLRWKTDMNARRAQLEHLLEILGENPLDE